MQSLHRLLRVTLVAMLITALLMPVAPVVWAQDTAVVHYHRPDGAYEGWGLHVWADAAQETAWADPLDPTGTDEFGLDRQVPLQPGATELGFIIHHRDLKDPGPDQLLDLGTSREAWVVSGVPDLFTQVVDPTDLPTGLPVIEEPPLPLASVSFPGNYVSLLAGVDWEPADLAAQATDLAGDGLWTMIATLPGGTYAFKVAVGGSWEENYGRDGVPDGSDIPFTVPEEGGDVRFAYDRTSGAIMIDVLPPGGPVPAIDAESGDGTIAGTAIYHDSRSDRYRSPFGAQPFGTDITLRLRTARNDVEAVDQVVANLEGSGGFSQPMTKVATSENYDWWEGMINNGDRPTVWNYHFQLRDGEASLIYADDGRLDGGIGRVYDELSGDGHGWDIYTYVPGFDVPEWAKNATIYQIFPERFRNGDPNNDPTADDWFYDEECDGHAWPVQPWNTIVPDPEPADPTRNPEWAGTYSCTFYGGDLQGVQEKLDYLQELGVTTLYFNPIFASPSNHKYDGRDYRQVDEHFGVLGDPQATNEQFAQLAAEVAARGMHLMLDGVPNHSSSDSRFFDRYSRHDELGACESEESPYRELVLLRSGAARRHRRLRRRRELPRLVRRFHAAPVQHRR